MFRHLILLTIAAYSCAIPSDSSNAVSINVLLGIFSCKVQTY